MHKLESKSQVLEYIHYQIESKSNEVILQYTFRVVVALVEWNLSVLLLSEKELSCVIYGLSGLFLASLSSF